VTNVTGFEALLLEYGQAPHEREVERVRRAILSLSGSDEAKLRYFLAVAKQDYRDVLFWADNPEQAIVDTPDKKRKMAEALRQLGMEPPDELKEHP